MDKLIEPGQWWWPFLVPVATGIFALIGSLFGATLGKTNEHKQWLRNERVVAYAAFLEINERVQRTLFEYQYQRKSPEDVYGAIDSISMQKLLLLGSYETKEACYAFGDAMAGLGKIFDPIPPDLERLPKAEKAYDAAIHRLRAAMADDLGLDKRAFQTVS